MTLSDKQANFLIDVAQLIFWCRENGYKVTGGELFRTAYQQAEYVRTGYSSTKQSKHLKRLAIDLNFFIDGLSMWRYSDQQMLKSDLQPVGDYWESLRVGNVWGGNWTQPFDPAHFQAA